jgi:Skp family chaperone for outer membrane proteins
MKEYPMRNRRSWIVVVAVAGAVWAVAASRDHAQSAGPAAEGRVGVVNLARVFKDCDQTQALNVELEAETKRIRLEGDKKMQAIRAEEEALQAFTPDSADWYARNQKLKRLKLEHRVFLALEEDRIGEDYMRWMKEIYETVSAGIAKVAKKRGMQVVLTEDEVDLGVTDPKLLQQLILNRKVIYADPQVDLTEEVLASLNADFAAAGGPSSVKFSR